jgi:hypothetical protein
MSEWALDDLREPPPWNSGHVRKRRGVRPAS